MISFLNKTAVFLPHQSSSMEIIISNAMFLLISGFSDIPWNSVREQSRKIGLTAIWLQRLSCFLSIVQRFPSTAEKSWQTHTMSCHNDRILQIWVERFWSGSPFWNHSRCDFLTLVGLLNELEIGIIYNSLTGNLVFISIWCDLRDQYYENQYWLVACGTIAYNRRGTVSQPHLGFQKFDIDAPKINFRVHASSRGGYSSIIMFFQIV